MFLSWGLFVVVDTDKIKTRHKAGAIEVKDKRGRVIGMEKVKVTR